MVKGPLVVILGPTASGKSALALELAERFNGEIICADSRTIYKHLDVSTAKPTPEEQRRVPHHLLNLVEPTETFSVAQFKELADETIADIQRRGRLPFLVGGTGLYIDAVLYDFTFREAAEAGLRQELSRLSLEELQQEIIRRGLVMPENERNPRHLMRTIETNGQRAQRAELPADVLLLGLTVDRQALRGRLAQRVESMLAGGLESEIKQAATAYGWDAPGLQAPAYKAFRGYPEPMSLGEASTRFVTNDMQLAKRQMTWFKRNKSVHWLKEQADAVDMITTLLNKPV